MSWCILLGILLLTPVLQAGQVSVYMENDCWPFHDDSDYTHGTRIEYAQDNGLRSGVQQQIYTPYDIKNPDQVAGRHPYAGTLTGFVGQRLPYAITGRLTGYHDYELMLGVLGPSSHADDVQRGIHKVIGAHEPKGWDHQLHDEAIVEGSYWHGLDWRFLGADFGWSMHLEQDAGVLVGTLQDAVGGGLALKMGYGFGTAENDHELYVRAARKPLCHIYGLVGCEGRWWLRNELLEGNAHYVGSHDTLTVDKEPLTGCLKAGAGARLGPVKLQMIWMWWTREYKTQESTPNYASLSIRCEI